MLAPRHLLAVSGGCRMADDEVADGNIPDTPWDIAVDLLVKERRLSLNQARDAVIKDWLIKGDTRPLAVFLLQSHRPGIEVRICLAKMLLERPPTPVVLVDPLGKSPPQPLPFRLIAVPRSRRKGNRADPALAVRNEILARHVRRRMPPYGSETLESAALSLEEEFSGYPDRSGRPISSDTIAKAYSSEKSKTPADGTIKRAKKKKRHSLP
jgi:hypothetical protein